MSRRFARSHECPTPSKIRYPSLDEARASYQRAVDNGLNITARYAYQCLCGAWHRTHRATGHRSPSIDLTTIPEPTTALAAATPTGDPMTHHIVWTHERDHVEARAVCDDPECLNRYVCVDGACEVYYDVRREPDGTVTHAPWSDVDRAVINRHRMERSDSCSALDFLNDDTSLLPELAETTAPFEIARTPIEPVWQGEDGVTWKPVAS